MSDEKKVCPDCGHEHDMEDGSCKCGCQTGKKQE